MKIRGEVKITFDALENVRGEEAGERAGVHVSSIQYIQSATSHAEGAGKRLTCKFSDEAMQAAGQSVLDWWQDSATYKGDLDKNEMVMIGLLEIYVTRFFHIVTCDVLFPNPEGPKRGEYRLFRWNSGVRSASSVLPIVRRGGKTYLVFANTFRFAGMQWMTELCRGVRMFNKKTGLWEDDITCGLREGTEELGLKVLNNGCVTDAGSIDPDRGILDQELAVIIVSGEDGIDLIVDPALINKDVSEVFGPTMYIELPDFLDAVRDGRIKDSLAMAAVVKAMAYDIIQPHELARRRAVAAA